MAQRTLVSFDWALKRLLRSKSNFEVLEGFLSELLKDDIKIQEILESESNQHHSRDKYNRLDLKVKNQKNEIVLIEVQYDYEFDYFQRILFASSKAISEHFEISKEYQDVIKVISINILYFDLGHGTDYIYRGRTSFTGIHTNDQLELDARQKTTFGKNFPHELYPEYYLLKVNQFNDIAKDTLDEWIYFLKKSEIKKEFKAKGLKKAKDVLDIMYLTPEERRAYESYMEDLSYQSSMYRSAQIVGQIEGKSIGLEEGKQIGLKKGLEEGKQIGLEEGKAIGVAEGILKVAHSMLKAGESVEKIEYFTGLQREEIEKLRNVEMI